MGLKSLYQFFYTAIKKFAPYMGLKSRSGEKIFTYGAFAPYMGLKSLKVINGLRTLEICPIHGA